MRSVKSASRYYFPFLFARPIWLHVFCQVWEGVLALALAPVLVLLLAGLTLLWVPLMTMMLWLGENLSCLPHGLLPCLNWCQAPMVVLLLVLVLVHDPLPSPSLSDQRRRMIRSSYYSSFVGFFHPITSCSIEIFSGDDNTSIKSNKRYETLFYLVSGFWVAIKLLQPHSSHHQVQVYQVRSWRRSVSYDALSLTLFLLECSLLYSVDVSSGDDAFSIKSTKSAKRYYIFVLIHFLVLSLILSVLCQWTTMKWNRSPPLPVKGGFLVVVFTVFVYILNIPLAAVLLSQRRLFLLALLQCEWRILRYCLQ